MHLYVFRCYNYTKVLTTSVGLWHCIAYETKFQTNILGTPSTCLDAITTQKNGIQLPMKLSFELTLLTLLVDLTRDS